MEADGHPIKSGATCSRTRLPRGDMLCSQRTHSGERSRTLSADMANAGKVLVVYGLGSILVAGVVLMASAPKLWKSALIQIAPATAGLAAILV